MSEIARFSGYTDWIDLDFVKRQRTPERAMKTSIQLQLAGLSLSNTISVLEELGVERSRKAVHDWVQKADLQPTEGRSPNHITIDETVIRVNDQQFCCTPQPIPMQASCYIYGSFQRQRPY